MSYSEVARAIDVDEGMLATWGKRQSPPAIYRHRLAVLEALVHEIQNTMRPDVIAPWMHRQIPAYGGATPHQLILAGRAEELLGTLRTLSHGHFS